MLTHVKELVQQNHKALLTMWPQAPAGIYSAGLKKRQFLQPIICAGIASVAKKAELFGKVDLIIIDECHLVSPSGTTMYRKFIGDLLEVNPKLRVIGFSATPYRMKGGALTGDESGLFSHVCYDLTSMEEFNKLIDDGWLATLVPKRTDANIDVTGVKTANGDFVQASLQAACDKEELTRRAVSEMIELGSDRKHWLIFASGVQHADHIAEELTARGIPAASVHSKMTEDRDEVIKAFKSGRFRAVVNNNVLTTGFDFPAIDMIGMLRPTRSPSLWVQMLGRGTRPFKDKKNCLVLDFAKNTARLGPINDPVLPTKRKKGGIGGAPIRTCQECETICHISLKECPECGHEFPPPAIALEAHAGTDELIARPTAPRTENYIVDRMVATKHISRAGGISLKISYWCGLQTFNEWIHLESSKWRGKAEAWWGRMSGEDCPATVDEALLLADFLVKPEKIQVFFSGDYPEVRDRYFDGDLTLNNSSPF